MLQHLLFKHTLHIELCTAVTAGDHHKLMDDQNDRDAYFIIKNTLAAQMAYSHNGDALRAILLT